MACAVSTTCGPNTACACSNDQRLDGTETLTAVSYTHLDVYKRQLLALAAFAWSGSDYYTGLAVKIMIYAVFALLSLIHI